MWHRLKRIQSRTEHRKRLLCMSNAASYQRVTPQVTGRNREADEERRQAEQPNTFRGTDRAHREPQGDAERWQPYKYYLTQ